MHDSAGASAKLWKCGEKSKTRTQIFWLFKACTIKVCHGNCLYKRWASSDPKKENKVNHLFGSWFVVDYLTQLVGANAILMCVYACCHVRLFETPWTIAHQAPMSMEFYRQEYWSELPFPSPGNLPHPEIKPVSLESPALTGEYFTSWAHGEAKYHLEYSLSNRSQRPVVFCAHFKHRHLVSCWALNCPYLFLFLGLQNLDAIKLHKEIDMKGITNINRVL